MPNIELEITRLDERLWINSEIVVVELLSTSRKKFYLNLRIF